MGEVMANLLIADRDENGRRLMKRFFSEAGYQVEETGSAARVLQAIMQKRARVVVLGDDLSDMKAADLVPLLKNVAPNLVIILLTNEKSLPLIRKMRHAGIFYHLLKPVTRGDEEEMQLAVHCAFASLAAPGKDERIHHQ